MFGIGSRVQDRIAYRRRFGSVVDNVAGKLVIEFDRAILPEYRDAEDLLPV